MGVAYKFVKSDFSQMRLSTSRFDYECGGFRSNFILNEAIMYKLVPDRSKYEFVFLCI